jgi:hypothetical protein
MLCSFVFHLFSAPVGLEVSLRPVRNLVDKFLCGVERFIGRWQPLTLGQLGGAAIEQLELCWHVYGFEGVEQLGHADRLPPVEVVSHSVGGVGLEDGPVVCAAVVVSAA